MRYGWEFTKTLYCLESHGQFEQGVTYIVSSEDDVNYYVMIDGTEYAIDRDEQHTDKAMFEVDEVLNSEVIA